MHVTSDRPNRSGGVIGQLGQVGHLVLYAPKQALVLGIKTYTDAFY